MFAGGGGFAEGHALLFSSLLLIFWKSWPAEMTNWPSCRSALARCERKFECVRSAAPIDLRIARLEGARAWAAGSA